MPIAAVPNYLQNKDPEFYLSAPPGHRFLLYFAAWGHNQETDKVDWRMKDRVPKIDKRTGKQKLGRNGPEWEDLPNNQYACTVAACKTPAFDDEKPRKTKPKVDPGFKPWQPLIQALFDRQTTLFATTPNATALRIDAVAIAPFTTGLGNEHPLENGFAFLNPYGLPYFPGSGVKGVLRQAARELASGDWGDAGGWSAEARYPLVSDGKTVLNAKKQPVMLTMFDALFGRETVDGETDHVRGALVFWDVIPQINGDSLMVEIMTPHQGHYYQIDKKKNPQAPHFQSPHESGQPNPISFLTVPPASRFVIHMQCDISHLGRHAPDLAQDGRWKKLLESAFIHAFKWLGFGAKTAVGYGAMERDAKREDELKEEAAKRKKAAE